MNILPANKSLPEQFQAQMEGKYRLDAGLAVSRAWEIYKKDFGYVLGSSWLMALIGGAAGSIPIVGGFISMAANPMLQMGFNHSLHNMLNDKPYTLSDLFTTKERFGDFFVTSLVRGLFLVLAFICFFIPGIYYGVAWGLTIPLMYIGGLKFMDAMKVSRKIVSRDFWQWILLGIIIFLIIIAGFLALFIGIIFVMPLIYCIQYAILEQYHLLDDPHDSLIDQIGTEPLSPSQAW